MAEEAKTVIVRSLNIMYIIDKNPILSVLWLPVCVCCIRIDSYI